MQIDEDEDALLDRGGHPTLRELLRQLVFSPGSGTIRLNKERLILQRANHTSRLRDQLVERYGRDEAFVILTRLGFVAGLEDAEFVRQSWPGLDPGDVFTAGTRLHMLCGCVRLRTVHNDFDLRKGRFSGEFIWQESAEAVEYRRSHSPSEEAVCWSQVGYASGYATRCFGKLIIYKELECFGCGRAICRVFGKPAESWGEDDGFVRLYRKEIVPHEMDASRPTARALERHDNDPVSKLLLAPARESLERVARFETPLLIVGERGTGKRTAARAWSEARFGDEATLDFVACDTLTPEGFDAAFDPPAASGRGRSPKRSQRRIVLTDVDLLPLTLQRRLARRLDEGYIRVAATTRLTLPALSSSAEFDQSLLDRLAVATVAMPPLRARKQDIPALADGLLDCAARRHNVRRPALTDEAKQAMKTLELPGNVTELDALISSALIAASPEGIGAPQILEIAARRRRARSSPFDGAGAKVLDGVTSGSLSLTALNRQICREAVERCNGNISAAARTLGITRPQLAYRLKLEGKN